MRHHVWLHFEEVEELHQQEALRYQIEGLENCFYSYYAMQV